MAKGKAMFFCKECGMESPKWLGQCPGCKAWNSLVEAPQAGKVKSAYGVSPLSAAEPVLSSGAVVSAEVSGVVASESAAWVWLESAAVSLGTVASGALLPQIRVYLLAISGRGA